MSHARGERLQDDPSCGLLLEPSGWLLELELAAAGVAAELVALPPPIGVALKWGLSVDAPPPPPSGAWLLVAPVLVALVPE